MNNLQHGSEHYLIIFLSLVILNFIKHLSLNVNICNQIPSLSIENANGSLNLLFFGSKRNVKFYNGYFINVYVFHTKEYGQGRKTYNSGVCVKG